MARMVVKTEHGPKVIMSDGKPILICMCGLSKTQPFCDKSHLKTLDEKEGKTYVYDEKGGREEVCGDCEEECSCCCGEDEKKK
jgi:CDGSH-type Zn-finger protein